MESVQKMQNSREERQLRQQAGFTLLELLISLTITAVIVTIVFGGLRVGVRAWEKGERDIEFQDRYRNVLNLLRRQIISVYIPPENTKPETEQTLFYFAGERNSLSFVSHRSLFPPNAPARMAGNAGMVYVQYRISEEAGGKRLAVYEKRPDFAPESRLPEPAAAGDDDFYELIDGAGDIQFEYLKVENVDTETGVPEWFWQSSWNSDEEKSYPRAVRISFQAEAASPPVHVVVPVDKNEFS